MDKTRPDKKVIVERNSLIKWTLLFLKKIFAAPNPSLVKFNILAHVNECVVYSLTKLRVIGEAPDSVITTKVQSTQPSFGGDITQYVLTTSSEVCHVNHYSSVIGIHIALQQWFDSVVTAEG